MGARPPAGPARQQLFVYGSLMRGGEAHAQLGAARFLGRRETVTGYAILLLVQAPNETVSGLARAGRTDESVIGELYDLSPEQLGKLDDWEDPAYDRQAIELSTGELVWSYCLPPNAAGLLLPDTSQRPREG